MVSLQECRREGEGVSGEEEGMQNGCKEGKVGPEMYRA